MLWLQQVFSFFARKKKQFHAFHVNSKVLQYMSLPKNTKHIIGNFRCCRCIFRQKNSRICMVWYIEETPKDSWKVFEFAWGWLMRSECLEVQRGWPSRTCAAWEIGGDLDCMPLYWIRHRSWPIFMLPLKEGDRFYGVEDVGVHPRCEGGLPVASQRSALPVNAMIHGCQYCQSTINVTVSFLSLLHVRRAQTLPRKKLINAAAIKSSLHWSSTDCSSRPTNTGDALRVNAAWKTRSARSALWCTLAHCDALGYTGECIASEELAGSGFWLL